MLKNIVRGMNDDMRNMLRADPDIAKESGVDFEAMFRSGVEAMDSQAKNVLTQGELATRIASENQIKNSLTMQTDIFNARVMNSLPSHMRFMVGSKAAGAAIQSLMALDIAAGGDGKQYAISALRTLGADTHSYMLAAFDDNRKITGRNINALVGLSNGLPYMKTDDLKKYIEILKTAPGYDDKVLPSSSKNALNSYRILAEKYLKEGNNVGDAVTKDQTGAKK